MYILHLPRALGARARFVEADATKRGETVRIPSRCKHPHSKTPGSRSEGASLFVRESQPSEIRICSGPAPEFLDSYFVRRAQQLKVTSLTNKFKSNDFPGSPFSDPLWWTVKIKQKLMKSTVIHPSEPSALIQVLRDLCATIH